MLKDPDKPRKPLKWYWSAVAVVAGAGLILLEFRSFGGVTRDNWFWVLIGALVVVLGLLDLLQRRGAFASGGGAGARNVGANDHRPPG